MFNQFKPIKVSDDFIQYLIDIDVKVRPAEVGTIDGITITEIQPMEPLAKRFYQNHSERNKQ